jgi:hypothetical protein
VAAPEDQNETSGEGTGPEPCSPCRGTGRVISQLGGKREEITCPWCDGEGTRRGSEHDAQARFKDAAAHAQQPDEPDEDPPPAAA